MRDRLLPAVVLGVATAAALASGAGPEEPDFHATPEVVQGSNKVELGIGDSLAFTLDHAAPGDVIELKKGCHPAPKGLAFDRSGRPDAWIVLRGNKDDRPVIDVAGGEFHIGGSYILIENVEVIGGWGNNIHIVPTSPGKPVSHVILRNVRSAEMGRGTGAALKIAGLWKNGHGARCERVYIEGCELTGSRDNALVDAVGVRRSVVRGCWLHDPVNLALKNAGIFFKGGSSEILIERNLVSGIRGNPAIMVGGDTGAKWFDALHSDPKVEGVDEVVRNNVIADFDDAGVECRGARGVKILSNTIVTSSSFAIFRLHWGGSGSGTKIGNSEIEIANNLVIGTGGARTILNDGNEDVSLELGRQLWAGKLARGSGPGVPVAPAEGDVEVSEEDLARLVANPSDEHLRGLPDALARYRLVPGSPALGKGSALASVVRDILDQPRSATAPSLGAFEGTAKPGARER